jgi:hypothetical protein
MPIFAVLAVIQMTICSTLKDMSKVIQARLDEPSRKRLVALVRELGWSPSKMVREGLRLLAVSYLPPRKKKRGIIGMGKFRSNQTDLATNKEYLEDLGRETNTR